jgi:hypothetical protein
MIVAWVTDSSTGGVLRFAKRGPTRVPPTGLEGGQSRGYP